MSSICREDDQSLGILELDQNLGDVEKPAELPPGNYTGEIQDVQKATSGKGNEYYSIKFVIPPKEIPADLQDQFEDGAILYWNRQVIPKRGDRRALFNLKKFIGSIGLDTDTTTIDPNEWMGCNARLKVVNETYQGETRAAIKSIESAEAPAGKPAAAAGKAAPANAKRGRK